jgi:hypothetical protein
LIGLAVNLAIVFATLRLAPGEARIPVRPLRQNA